MTQLEGSIAGQSLASNFKYNGCDEVNKLNALLSAAPCANGACQKFQTTFELKTNFKY